MNIRISNKAIELNNQNSQKLEMFLSITARMAGELHPQKERLSSTVSHLWINLISLFIQRPWSQSCSSSMNWRYTDLSTCSIHIRPYLQRRWSSGLLRSGAALWTELLEGGGLAALWLSELSKPSAALLPCMWRTGRETFLRSPLDH